MPYQCLIISVAKTQAFVKQYLNKNRLFDPFTREKESDLPPGTEIARTEKGYFAKGNKAHESSRTKLTNEFRKFIEELNDKTTSQTRLREIFQSLYETAIGQGRSAVAAATLILDRCYGRVPLADEDQAAIRAGGITIVIPGMPPTPPPPLKLNPAEFIEGEIIDDKDE